MHSALQFFLDSSQPGPHPVAARLPLELKDASSGSAADASNPNGQSVQRIVLAASRSEPVREPEEIFFVDCVQHLHHSTLNDLIFQRGDPQRALPPIRFWDVSPS